MFFFIKKINIQIVMKEKTKEIISISSYIAFLIMSLLILIFSLKISKGIAIAIYISFIICMLIYICLIISIIIYKIRPELKSCFLRKNLFVLLSIQFVLLFEPLIYTINISYYEKYKKICPFTLGIIDLSLHSKRRCLLYNINKNSRYSFQYICSYNPTDELKKLKLTKNEFETSNKLEIIRCLPVKNLLNENILSDFLEEYNNTDKYYCSLVYQPKHNTFIDNIECDKNRSKINYIFLSLLYFQIIFILIKNIIFKTHNNSFNDERIRERNAPRIPNRFNRIEEIINLNRMLNLLRELLNMNLVENISESQMSTEKSQKQNENEDNWEAEKTKNIIIDNHQDYEIDININNIYKEKENQNDSINIDQINADIKSDEFIIKNENN